MIIGIVLGVIALLALAVVIAAARDTGPVPADVAIGYVTALVRRDFDAVYRMIDPDLLAGRNRPEWVASQRVTPHVALGVDQVHVVVAVVTADDARVEVAIGEGRVVPVDLVRRHRIWTVTAFDGIAAASTRQ